MVLLLEPSFVTKQIFWGAVGCIFGAVGCIFGAVSIGEKMAGWLYESDNKTWSVPSLQSHHTSSRLLSCAAVLVCRVGRMALVR